MGEAARREAPAAAPASARERVALVADPGSFAPWDEDVVSGDPLRFAGYPAQLAAARARSGEAEAVVTGRATVAGRPLALVASEFGFLGGSVGAATGERIARAFERARAARLPLLALPASGGTRMQEGTLALVQMARLAAAAQRLRDAGLPYLVCLADPTTGGVLASWGSLATVTFAFPGAQVGFAGPRVVAALACTPLPAGVQSAERLHARGLIDALVAPEALRERVLRVLAATAAPGAPPGAGLPPAMPAGIAPAAPPPAMPAGIAPAAPPPPPAGDAWASLGHARDPGRPRGDALLAAWARDVTELRGDRAGGGEDPALLAALARLHGIPCVVVATCGGPDGRGAAPGPAAYRKAQRAMALADQLGLPFVTIVDTPGAALSAEAEEGGLAAAIAGCLARASTLRVPTLAVLAGEGGSGGALALLAADRVLCAEHASLSAIAPEGASAILHRDAAHAAALAAAQGAASWELARRGLVDAVVPERLPAAREPAAFAARLGAAVAAELHALPARPAAERRAARERRHAALGGA